MAKVDNSEHVKRLRDWLKRQKARKGPKGLRLAKRSKGGVWTFWKVTSASYSSPIQGGTLDYRPGRRVRLVRNRCSTNPLRECAEGLHLWPFLPTVSFVEAWSSSYEGHVVEVEVAEEDIVAVPKFSFKGELKLRVCNMRVTKEVFPKEIRKAQLKRATEKRVKELREVEIK